MSNVEVIELSLIIDDNTTLSFKLDINQTDQSSINAICEDIASTYSLSIKAKKKLYEHISEEISKIKEKIKKMAKQTEMKLTDDTNNHEKIFDRLYYQGTQAKLEKAKKNERKHQESLEEEMKKYSFTPKINAKSNILSQKEKNQKISISEKLYNQRKKVFGIKKSEYAQMQKSAIMDSNPSHSFSTVKSPTHQNAASQNEKWFDRLYKTQSQYKEKKEQLKNTFYKSQCPFEPKISKGSYTLMKKRNESPSQFYNRLSSSKTLNLCKSANDPMNNMNRGKLLSPRRAMSSNMTEPRTEVPYYLEKRSINEIKTEQNLIKNWSEVKNSKEKGAKLYFKNTNENLEKYKLNKIKEIFEILIKDNNKINFDSLTQKNIPKHIVDKVVKPTCYMINDRNLEFNFQNFYLISNELLNNFFI